MNKRWLLYPLKRGWRGFDGEHNNSYSHKQSGAPGAHMLHARASFLLSNPRKGYLLLGGDRHLVACLEPHRMYRTASTTPSSWFPLEVPRPRSWCTTIRQTSRFGIGIPSPGSRSPKVYEDRVNGKVGERPSALLLDHVTLRYPRPALKLYWQSGRELYAHAASKGTSEPSEDCTKCLVCVPDYCRKTVLRLSTSYPTSIRGW